MLLEGVRLCEEALAAGCSVADGLVDRDRLRRTPRGSSLADRLLGAGALTALGADGGGRGRFARSVRNMPTASTTLTIPSATLITSSRRDTLVAPDGRRRQQIARDDEGG